MSRRNWILIVIVLALVLIGAGAFYFWQQSNAQRAASTATRQTGALSRGELSASVSGAGNITAPQQATLSFGVSGVPVTAVNVKIGDAVKKGDVLAQADATELAAQLKLAQVNLKSAQAKLTDLQESATSQEIAIAESQIKGAQASYDSALAKMEALKTPPSAVELQAARAQLAAAQASYETAAAKAQMTNEQIIIQRASLEKARIALQAAQAAYNAIAWQDNATSSSAAQTLQTATIDYETAQANYNLSMAEMNDSALKSAEASLANARKSLTDLTAEPTADELASAQAAIESASQNLMQAKQNLEDIKAGAAETDLLAAQASVDSAQNSLAQAQRALDDAKIIAPFDGVVASVDTFVGQTASANATVITLVNTDDLRILVSLSEVDIAQIKPGQTVQLSFDALNGRAFPGEVVAISPLGSASQGVVNYNVTIALTNPDPAILPGMTAQANIITERVTDALIAPSRAVRTQGNRRVMTLLFEGREIPLIVQVGLVSESGTQILSASMSDGQAVQLHEGDTVLLTTTTTTSTQGGGFGGPGAGGFVVPIR